MAANVLNSDDCNFCFIGKKEGRCVASGSLCCVSRPNQAASGSGSECHLLQQVPELFHQNMWPCKLGTNYSVRERSVCCGKNDQERTLLPLDSEDMRWQPPVTWPPCWQGCCWWPPAPWTLGNGPQMQMITIRSRTALPSERLAFPWRDLQV